MTTVHVLAVGDFGAEVARCLGRAHPGTVVSHDRAARGTALLDSSGWPPARIRVLASWRETPRLMETLDARSADWRTPWFPVVNEHPRLRVGPVVVPGEGACYRCFRRRRAQHEPPSTRSTLLHTHYDAHPEAGVAGFLPHHVDMAAAAASDVLHRIERGESADTAGNVRHWNVLEHRMSSARVVGVHGCDRCRRSSPDAATASWEPLARELTPLLAGAAPAPASPSAPASAPVAPAAPVPGGRGAAPSVPAEQR
ncbi:TOMM precursor leader peptide-binding protein [Streptomyces iconiensis]|uniref:TOMM leader peptide-binding protein n=1 Tax=Streptomyces iconiensis TaxID=1384038 RepID=A0ABT6ZW01_9ACTN|nr:TOMM precursor leader peptide-binding protein [Streptomyces iconiensis]MDJ1132791.1 TOMM precursor leader peptide-binding protein [Streptomyces iconiensis]